MTMLTVGDPAPWFAIPSTSNPTYHFDTVGGYRVVLFFFGSGQIERACAALKRFCAHQDELAQMRVPFFGVSVDPGDRPLENLIQNPTYCKLLWDFERQASALYGVCQASAAIPDGDTLRYRPTTFVLNENLQIVQVLPLQDSDQHVDQVMGLLRSWPAPPLEQMATRQAPALFISRVFDPDFCRHLIDLYEADGGHDSGFMRQIDGKTVEVLDYSFKQRRDFAVTEPKLRQQVNDLIVRRVKPEIEKAFQFSITRFERHLVSCYEAQHQGFFNRHRDNTTKGTAHRRFAMSLNLNAGEYDGGCLRFPEYGPQLYRPNTGEAVIFSCSLLHEATPVTRGRRYVLLSFFYDDADAEVREQNQQYVVLKQPERSADGGSNGASGGEGDPPHRGFAPAVKDKRGFQPSRAQKKR